MALLNSSFIAWIEQFEADIFRYANNKSYKDAIINSAYFQSRFMKLEIATKC